MIEKLESAGLGFYVKATETQQRLGWEHTLCKAHNLSLLHTTPVSYLMKVTTCNVNKMSWALLHVIKEMKM